jgi:FkbM family methyltransferase
MTYFPNVKAAAWVKSHELVNKTQQLDQESAFKEFEILSKKNSSLVTTTFHDNGNFVIANQMGLDICFPTPLPRIKLAHIVCGYAELIFRKYNLPGFVEVEDGDIVIEIGAFVGGFTMKACEQASKIFSFEPAPGNFDCLNRNLSSRTNVSMMMSGAGSATGNARLNLSTSAVEHSFLSPDEGASGESLLTPMVRLDDFIRDESISRVDFLKLEAEGFEIEVFEGLGEFQALKLAIDVSPERDGQSPEGYFREALTPDYEIKQRGNVLFAKHK